MCVIYIYILAVRAVYVCVCVTTLWVLICILARVSVVLCVFYRRVGAQLIGALIPLDG